ncbi:type II toxin-antitoxin system RelE/ParE family toxin [Sphingomonas sp. BK235]|jgi:addiction module RelE/StbE family toxin|uniref:type II toxin-antitoxin system RelE/ParE family toxin n=1 Tax=Sphingomonas sp. BK235 TaxID=2512131 RepID=UPI00104D1430|nr:type II toxin-antitoxin system RelE/ParE family toxin [Sphingomonas sp. BK235]TCP35033.1 addiction module RelE/StbE family toxin [Sphingomonas sp. BK235]
MARVIWRNAALDDLDRIFHFIARHNDQAARRVAERLIACGESLRAFPRRGRPAPDGCREMTIVPPYILRYEIEGATVLIRSIRHGARLPDQTL